MDFQGVMLYLGLTTSQLITAVPVFLVILSLLFKVIKLPFNFFELITTNKYSSLNVNDKIEAVKLVYKEGDETHCGNCIRELKLSDYGLKHSLFTLRVFFDYQYSKHELSGVNASHDFLKQVNIFRGVKDDLPVIAFMGLVRTLFLLILLFCLGCFGFITGIKSITEVMHEKINWVSVATFLVYVFGQIFFMLVILALSCEVGSVIKAAWYSKKLKVFHSNRLYEKYKK